MALPKIVTPGGKEDPQESIIEMVTDRLHSQIHEYPDHRDLIRTAVIMGMQIVIGFNPDEFEEEI